MNSQIFAISPQQKTKKTTPPLLTPGKAQALCWLSAIILIIVVVLFPERPAWGDERDSRLSSDATQGHYHQTATADPTW